MIIFDGKAKKKVSRKDVGGVRRVAVKSTTGRATKSSRKPSSASEQHATAAPTTTTLTPSPVLPQSTPLLAHLPARPHRPPSPAPTLSPPPAYSTLSLATPRNSPPRQPDTPLLHPWHSAPTPCPPHWQPQPYSVPAPMPQQQIIVESYDSLLTEALDRVRDIDLGQLVPARFPRQRASVQNLQQRGDEIVDSLQNRGEDFVNQRTGGGLCDLISCKFDNVITSIDGGVFSGDERELGIYQPPDPAIRGGWGLSRGVNDVASSAIKNPKTTTNCFSKANLYANSRLPPYLPPLRLYLPAYPLICLAAQYSDQVYQKPTGKEKEAHVAADWRLGTKAMVIKSVPIDETSTVVFAIRGSQTFMDWAVNLRSAPISPSGFLDDGGNLVHAGFLSVAKKMIKPVAARLRSLLEEDPSRASCDLVMTGHSAGGAVASLLFAHMLAATARSELNTLTGCFKRIHCIAFGAPPVSLLPLQKSRAPRYQKSLFLSFINEGDPVPRADKAYIRSLLDLYASPAPGTSCVPTIFTTIPAPKFKFNRLQRPKPCKALSAPASSGAYWPVPPSTLSNAGKLIVLRTPSGAGTNDDDVKAEITTDEQLREVVFGDPMMHMMTRYARRVEVLATRAVTGRSALPG